MDAVNYKIIKDNQKILQNLITKVNNLEENNRNIQKYLKDRLNDTKIYSISPVIEGLDQYILGSEEQPIHVVGIISYNDKGISNYPPPVVDILDAKTNEKLVPTSFFSGIYTERRIAASSEFSTLLYNNTDMYYVKDNQVVINDYIIGKIEYQVIGKFLFPGTKSIRISAAFSKPINKVMEDGSTHVLKFYYCL